LVALIVWGEVLISQVAIPIISEDKVVEEAMTTRSSSTRLTLKKHRRSSWWTLAKPPPTAMLVVSLLLPLVVVSTPNVFDRSMLVVKRKTTDQVNYRTNSARVLVVEEAEVITVEEDVVADTTLLVLIVKHLFPCNLIGIRWRSLILPRLPSI